MWNVGVIFGKNRLRVTDEGAVEAIIHDHNPADEDVFRLPFSQFFTDDGSSAGSSDMKVAGTVAAPQNFFISAQQDRDIFINNISIEIADASAALNKFGNITALTNGVKLTWATQDNGGIVIESALKSNWDFVRMAGANPAFGDGAGAFRAGNVSGTSEGYTPVVKVSEQFGIRDGFLLRRGTMDRITFAVQDDTTGVDSFNIKGYGNQII